MADFRRVRCLLAYSGGTVPGFHRIHYSPSISSKMFGTQAVYEFKLIINPIYFTVKTASSVFHFSLFFHAHRPMIFGLHCVRVSSFQ